MPASRRIIGLQLHHSVALADAGRYASNLLVMLDGVSRRMEDPSAVIALREQLAPLVRAVGAEATAARLRLQLHQSDPDFRRYVDGDLPWPDENPEGFVARCRCHDRCLYHDQRVGTEDDCNCGEWCRQHEEAA